MRAMEHNCRMALFYLRQFHIEYEAVVDDQDSVKLLESIRTIEEFEKKIMS